MLCHKYTWRVLQNGISEGKSSNYQISCFMWQLFILTKTKILTENCLKTLPETFAIYWFFIIYIGKLIKQNLQKIFHVQWSSFSYYLATFSKNIIFFRPSLKLRIVKTNKAKEISFFIISCTTFIKYNYHHFHQLFWLLIYAKDSVWRLNNY